MASSVTDNAKSERALVSWKEIASFLNRGERTVKRWETERGLPVRRVPGGERGSVYAYPSELTEWLKGKSEEFEAEVPVSGEPISSRGPGQASGVPPAAATAGSAAHHPGLSPARIAAWVAPLALTAALILYFSIGHKDTHVTAVGDRGPSVESVPALAPDSVAVLPFAYVGGNASSDYLTDGITESLIGNLAHVPRLKVRSRDAVFRLKGKDIEVQEAGDALGVAVVVSGRVAVHDNRIEVSAELTDVRDNTEIWGKRYSAETSQLIPLQQQIAGDVAEKLRSTLSSADKQRVTRQGTLDIAAYTLYLKGRYGWNQRDPQTLEASIGLFNQAIARDPNYALAYSALADVYSVLPFFGANPAEVFPKASVAARKALLLDPTLAHPHAILGSIEMEYDWDFAGGEAEFKEAFELDPNDATAHQWFAESLGMIGGRERDALSEIDLAHMLDPTSLIIRRVKGSVLVAARRYDDAIAECQQLLDANPTFNLAHDCLGYAYWGKRMYPEVVEQWQAYHLHDGDAADAAFGEALERGFRAAGWRGALDEAIKARLRQRQTAYASPFEIARFYADLGEKEKAFEWLETAYREHDFLLRELNTDFEVDSLRSDPRFAALVRRVGLPKLN
jgi:TolB-like protein